MADKEFDFDAAPPPPPSGGEGGNAPALSVSEIAGAVKKTLESNFNNIRIRGEVSGYRGPHSSGHAYFTLKDENARLDAVIWKGVFQKLPIKPAEGMAVVASGRLSSYPGSSKYQLVVEKLAPEGEGALLAELRRRRIAYEAEGIFAPDKRKPLPFLPEVVGVVASPTGAVIRDILHRIFDRFPRRVIVWPAAAQGERCPPEVTAGIRGFNALPKGGPIPRPDVIVVARGGGSMEDLWGYNDDMVVRAAAASAIPLISAVGHETDWTLIDLAADKRAPTPTAAAEMAVPVRAGLVAMLEETESRRQGAVRRLLEARRGALRGLARGLPRPESLLEAPRQRLDSAETGLPRALKIWRGAKEREFSEAAGRLRAAGGRLSEKLSGAARELKLGEERLNRAPRAFLAAKARELAAAPLSATPLRHLAARRRDRLAAMEERLQQAPRRLLALKRGEWARRIPPSAALNAALAQRRARLEAAAPRLGQAALSLQTAQSQKLESLGRLLESYSFKAVLDRGFALVRDSEGRPLRRALDAAPGEALRITLQEGEIAAKVEGQAQPKPRRKAPPKPLTETEAPAEPPAPPQTRRKAPPKVDR